MKKVFTESPTNRIYEIVRTIPAGKVATYGQVAELAGNRKMARAVGNALHRNPAPGIIPCHRVVDSRGKLSDRFAFGGASAQAELLGKEGVSVIDGHVDLKEYQMVTSGPVPPVQNQLYGTQSIHS